MKRTLSLFDKLVILHSGFSVQFGWTFITMGSFFSAIFVPLAILQPDARFALFVLIFPLVGTIMAYFGYRKNFRVIDLLEIGKIAKGKIVSSEFTGATITINNSRYPVMKYTIAFGDENGEAYTITDSTHLPVYQDAAGEVAIIYPREAPSDGILFSAISAAPELLPDGDLKPFPLYKAVNLILPAIFVLIIGGAMYLLGKGVLLGLLGA